MKRSLITGFLMVIALIIIISGCGGAGGGETTTTPPPIIPPQTTPQATIAVLKISSQGTLPSGSLIGGIDITVTLPSGVTVKNQTNPPETDAGVVVTSALAVSNSTLLSTYTAASGATKGAVRVIIANSNGFGTGEFVTVNCNIAAGSSPTASDFSVSNLLVKDLNGTTINGLTATITADIR